MITDIKNPRWSSPAHDKIIVDGIFEGEEVQFVASPTDCTEHGRKIYQDCADGKYDKIAEYEPPVITPEEIEANATAELNRRLSEIMTPEIKALAEVDDEFREEYKGKIKALLDLKTKKGWPDKIDWPD